MTSRTKYSQRDRWLLPLGLASAVLASYALYGYAAGLHNHAIQLPLVHVLQNADLYPGDSFVATLVGYCTFFWPVFAYFIPSETIEGALLLGHVFMTLAVVSGVYALAASTFPDESWPAPLAVWIFLWCPFDIGGESLHWFYFAHTPVATACGLWILVLALRKRIVASWLCVGLVFNIHAVQAAYLALMLVAAEFGMPTNRRRLAFALSGAALCALPNLLWLTSISAGDGPSDLEQLLRMFFPRHFFVSAFTQRDWFEVCVTLGAFSLAVPLVWSEPKARCIAKMVLGLLGLWLLGGALAEFAPNALVLKLHVFRSSSFVVILTVALLAGAIPKLLRRCPESLRLPAATVLTALLALLPAVPTEHSGISGIDWRVEMLFGLVAIAAGIASRPVRGTVGIALNFPGAVLLALVMADVATTRSRGNWAYLAGHKSWVETQLWARESTCPDDIFLTPAFMEGFRAYSRRPVLGEWKDGAAIMWDTQYAATWRAWYEGVGATFESSDQNPIYIRLEKIWGRKTQADIEAMACAGGAHYIVLRHKDHGNRRNDGGTEWIGKALYSNETYFVVAATEACG